MLRVFDLMVLGEGVTNTIRIARTPRPHTCGVEHLRRADNAYGSAGPSNTEAVLERGRDGVSNETPIFYVTRSMDTPRGMSPTNKSQSLTNQGRCFSSERTRASLPYALRSGCP